MGRAFHASLLGLLHYHVRSRLVGWVVEQTTDVVHKERIKKISDLFLVGKFHGALEWDPDTLEMHWSNLHNVAELLAF
jgi:hypothetical protein